METTDVADCIHTRPECQVVARREVAPALSQNHSSTSPPTRQATQLSAALPWAGLGLH